MAYGGITPVGLPSEWPVLVDDAVVAQPWVVVGSGTRGSKLLLPGARLAELGERPRHAAAPGRLNRADGRSSSAQQVDDRDDADATMTTR